MSIDRSSLTPEDEPRGRKLGGGVWPVSSENVSQKSLPLELNIACCLKLLDRPDEISPIIWSSGIPPRESWVVGLRLGDDCVVVDVDNMWCCVGSRSISLSRV